METDAKQGTDKQAATVSFLRGASQPGQSTRRAVTHVFPAHVFTTADAVAVLDNVQPGAQLALLFLPERKVHPTKLRVSRCSAARRARAMWEGLVLTPPQTGSRVRVARENATQCLQPVRKPARLVIRLDRARGTWRRRRAYLGDDELVRGDMRPARAALPDVVLREEGAERLTHGCAVRRAVVSSGFGGGWRQTGQSRALMSARCAGSRNLPCVHLI